MWTLKILFPSCEWLKEKPWKIICVLSLLPFFSAEAFRWMLLTQLADVYNFAIYCFLRLERTCDCLSLSLVVFFSFFRIIVYDILRNVFYTKWCFIHYHVFYMKLVFDIDCMAHSLWHWARCSTAAIATSSLIFRSLRSHHFSFCWFSLSILIEISVVENIFFMIFISFKATQSMFYSVKQKASEWKSIGFRGNFVWSSVPRSREKEVLIILEMWFSFYYRRVEVKCQELYNFAVDKSGIFCLLMISKPLQFI